MMKPSNTRPSSSNRYPLEMNTGDKKEFLKKARSLYSKDVDADEHNIEPAREDIQFVIGDQWDAKTKARRNRLNKPVLTVNRLPAFVAQYLGSWQQTDTTMKLLPMKGGSRATAELRQGLIRTIIREPVAKHALYTAMETAYIAGIGNFGLELVDNKYDVFDKDIKMVPMDDPFQVIWDRASREPTGADALHCFVTRYQTVEDFKKAYPKAESHGQGWMADEADHTVMTAHGWEIDDMIRICHFWQMKEEDVVVGLERGTGDVIDITDWTAKEISSGLEIDSATGDPIKKETTRPYAECYVMSGHEVLEGPFRLNISRLPYFRVEGWALQEASVRYRWGFVRNAKDPQRLHNYWRSILAEELQKSPSSKWLLDSTAMKSGLADQFRTAHLSGDPVLMWDSQADGAKPEFIPPPQMNSAVLTEAQMSVQDIKDVTNKHEASMGVTSNEVSGKAITARQKVSELGDRIYLENMNMAQAECAKVINELIPEVYDTNRVIKISGDDDQILLQEINGDFGDETPDITKGKYDITYTVGPSYATKREEATETMLTLMNHMPQTGNYIVDIIARNMDIPGAEEIAERMMSLLPPGMVNLERLPESARKRVEEKQQASAKEAEQNQQIQMKMMQGQFMKMEAEIKDISARAMKSEAQAELALSQVGVDENKVVVDAAIRGEKNEIDAARVGVEIDKNEIETAKMGMEAAYKVGEMQDKNADRKAQQEQQAQQAQKKESE
jgi:hypothetical protein